MIIKLRAAGRTVVEVGVPHYPRTAGSATGREAAGRAPGRPGLLAAAPADVGRSRPRALRRGEPMVQLQK